jgi:hypothetical protein
MLAGVHSGRIVERFVYTDCHNTKRNTKQPREDDRRHGKPVPPALHRIHPLSPNALRISTLVIGPFKNDIA